jgi:hypothetical protein
VKKHSGGSKSERFKEIHNLPTSSNSLFSYSFSKSFNIFLPSEWLHTWIESIRIQDEKIKTLYLKYSKLFRPPSAFDVYKQ